MPLYSGKYRVGLWSSRNMVKYNFFWRTTSGEAHPFPSLNNPICILKPKMPGRVSQTSLLLCTDILTVRLLWAALKSSTLPLKGWASGSVGAGNQDICGLISIWHELFPYTITFCKTEWLGLKKRWRITLILIFWGRTFKNLLCLLDFEVLVLLGKTGRFSHKATSLVSYAPPTSSTN